MDEVGQTLGAAAQAFVDAHGLDLGHASINTAAGQLMTGLGTQFGQFHQHALRIGQSLQATQQDYAGVDATGTAVIAGAAAGSSFAGASGSGSGQASGPAQSNSDPAVPYAGTGLVITPEHGVEPII
jgi:hypothetical protein